MFTRPLTAADVDAVARLVQQADRNSAGIPLRTLGESIRRTYLDQGEARNPSPSRVFEGIHGISGFLGAVPLPLQFRGRRIDAVVAGPLVVHPSLRLHPFLGSRLQRDFFDAAHELLITKTADTAVRSFWNANGSTTLPQLGMRWMRILRPASFAAGIAMKARAQLSREAADRALAQLARHIGSRTPVLGTRVVSSLRAMELTPSRWGEGMEQVATRCSLRPVAESDSLDARMESAAARCKGRMVGTALYRGSQMVGWYLYDARAGDTAQVLQVTAAPESEQAVIEHLFGDAWRRECLAIAGSVHPPLMPDLSAKGCLFSPGRTQVQVHSKNRDLLHALHRGDALLTPAEWDAAQPVARGTLGASRPQLHVIAA